MCLFLRFGLRVYTSLWLGDLFALSDILIGREMRVAFLRKPTFDSPRVQIEYADVGTLLAPALFSIGRSLSDGVYSSSGWDACGNGATGWYAMGSTLWFVVAACYVGTAWVTKSHTGKEFTRYY